MNDIGRALTSLAAAALLAATPLTLQAQDANAPGEGLGLKGNLGYYSYDDDLGADELGGLDDGIGFEGVVSWGWPSGFELGAGVGFASQDVFDGEPASETTADVTTVFLEPTYRFNVGAAAAPHLHPFIGVRGGYASLGFDEDFPAVGEDDTKGGFQAGGLAGLELWLSHGVGVVGSVTYDHLSFDLNEDDEISIGDEDTLSGGRLGFRGGLKLRLQ